MPFQSQCCCSFTIFYTLHNLILSIPIHSAQGPTTHPAPRALRWVRLPRRRPQRTAAVPTFGRGDLTTRPTSVRQWTLRSCAGHWWGLEVFWGDAGPGMAYFFWIKPSNSLWFRSWHSSPKIVCTKALMCFLDRGLVFQPFQAKWFASVWGFPPSGCQGPAPKALATSAAS